MRTSISILTALFFVSPLLSQNTGRVLGYSSRVVSSGPGAIQVQDILASCPTAFTLCPSVIPLPSPGSVPIGGSAWDDRTGLLWVTNGSSLSAYRPKGCAKQCDVAVVTMDSAAFASGLAIAENKRQLWMLETKPGYVGLRPWSLNGCTAVPTRGGCSFPTPSRSSVAGGLTYDIGRDLLYFTVSEPTAIAWSHTLYVAKAQSGSACQPLCKIALKECSLVQRAITGLAFDAWTQRLFATDGQNTRILQVLDPLNCKFQDLGCCKKGLPGDDWLGLAWQPAFTTTTFGKGCADKGCGSCPSPTHELGDATPSIGNPDFVLTLRKGPTGGYGIFVFGLGRCTKGVGVPFLCTAIYPALQPPPLLFGIGVLQGTGACNGELDLKLPLPADAAFCGATLCTQWLIVCSGPSFALSNALEWQITGG